MNTPILKTERLILRPVTLDDVSSIQKYFANWGIIKHLSMQVPWPYPEDGALDFYNNTIKPRTENDEGFFFWAITVKTHGNELVGLINYRAKEDATGNRGFWLAQEFQNKGYMSEAITAVQDFLFFDLGIDSLRATNAIDNLASRRVKEKTGAVFLRIVDCPHHSGKSESELWEITKEGWAKFRNKEA